MISVMKILQITDINPAVGRFSYISRELYTLVHLQVSAAEFQTSSGRLKRKMWWKNLKMMLILGLIVVVVIVIIIVAAVGIPSGGDGDGGGSGGSTSAPAASGQNLEAQGLHEDQSLSATTVISNVMKSVNGG